MSQRIVVARDAGIAIRSLRDISDAIGACMGACLLLDEEDLAPEFFDLRSGFAGELLQKLVNYQVRSAIVVRDPTVYGERVTELAREHRRHPLVRFVANEDEGYAWLAA